MQNLLMKNNLTLKMIFTHGKTIKNSIKASLMFLLILITSHMIFAQSMIDVSIGTSNQDNILSNLAFRYQFSDKFRIGLEAQFGSPKYRFIDAKPITTGYANMVSIPFTLRIYQREKIRLDFYNKLGLRFKGILDPDENDIRDSILNSTSYVFEPGLLVSVNLAEKLDLQSGFTVPVIYQSKPSAFIENIYPGLLHLGLSFSSSRKSTVFGKTMFGGSTGADGDTQKFGWSLQAGFRLSFGERDIPVFIEPSF